MGTNQRQSCLVDHTQEVRLWICWQMCWREVVELLGDRETTVAVDNDEKLTLCTWRYLYQVWPMHGRVGRLAVWIFKASCLSDCCIRRPSSVARKSFSISSSTPTVPEAVFSTALPTFVYASFEHAANWILACFFFYFCVADITFDTFDEVDRVRYFRFWRNNVRFCWNVLWLAPRMDIAGFNWTRT